MGRRLRKAEWIAVFVVLAVILAIVLWPTPVDRPYDSGLARILFALHRAGVPRWVDYDFVEVSANIIMFVPLGALIASVSMRPLWWVSGVLGLALSLCIEFAQTEFLPQRFGSVGDLVSNTVGALLGGAIVFAIRAVRQRALHRSRR
jgi:VanZ family protein